MFAIVIEKKAKKFLKALPKKTRRIVIDKILELQEDPFPGGNKEKLEYAHLPAIYRLHISRSFTVFYIIETDEHLIKIERIQTIERAHKEYFRR